MLTSKRADACAAISAGIAEPLGGMPAKAKAWILLEHPGPWPHDAVDAVLGAELAAEIGRRAPNIRINLIRRAREVGRPFCVLAWTSGDKPWMREGRLGTYADLLDLDLASFAAGGPIDFGDEASEPLFAVCTHGRRDACCSEFGLPTHRAVASGHERTWECTHLGGHRFAANLVCFPHGYGFGRLNPVSGLSAANAYADGRLQLANLRGRSGVPVAAQAAEQAVRLADGIDGVNQLSIVDVMTLADDLVDVTLDAADHRRTVRMQRQEHGEPVAPGCGATEPAQRYAWVPNDGASA